MPRFCANCGRQLYDGSRFCASCGAPSAVPNSASVQPMMNQNPMGYGMNVTSGGNIPNGIVIDGNGALHWHYTKKMISHPEVLLKFIKIYSIIMAVTIVFIGIIVCIEEEDVADTLPPILGIGVLMIVGGAAASFLVWLIVCAVKGNTTEMDFELNAREVIYRSSAQDARRNKRIARTAQVVGVVTANPQLFLQGTLVNANAEQQATGLSGVTCIELRRRNQMMWVKTGPVNYVVYAYPHQYDYILNTLRARCPNARIKGR